MRLVRSIRTLVDQEGPSCRYLFDGERLVPFAALYAGECHPDGMSLTQADCDLLCFDNTTCPPAVVLWHAHKAQSEYMACESASVDREVNYESFVERVADSFIHFTAMLTTAPPE